MIMFFLEAMTSPRAASSGIIARVLWVQAHVVAYSQDVLLDLGEEVSGLLVFVFVQHFQVDVGHVRSLAVVGGGSQDVKVSESAAGVFLGNG